MSKKIAIPCNYSKETEQKLLKRYLFRVRINRFLGFKLLNPYDIFTN